MAHYPTLIRIGLICLIGCATPESMNDSSGVNGPDEIRYVHQASIQDAYTFDEPDAQFKLSNDLKEISGITIFDDEHLAAIEDERGKIYRISLSTGEIVEDDRFEDDGDYEDLVRIDTTFFVLRSDGDIFEAPGWPVKKKDTKKYETILGSKNDTEGLAYDAKHNRLLIACKEYPGKDLDQKRAIYAFDLSTKEVDPTPAFLIDLRQVNQMKPDHALNNVVRRLVTPLSDISGFKPSAIAIHPITGHLFILSSVRKLLVALNENGDIDAVWELDEKTSVQPEGLTFLPNGDLFISNEGNGQKANLLRFNYNA